MADGGVRVETYYARGMLEVRTTLHLALRSAVRANQVLQRSGAAAEGSGLWRAALPAFVLLDVAIWLVLRRSDRFGLAWRLPLDALDAAFWTLSPLPAAGHYDWAVLIAVPLAIEAGVRLGWRGLAVPVAILVATGASATVAGKPLGFFGFGWIVLSVAMGVAFFRYCRLLDQRAEVERHRAMVAAERRAYLAGQNHVAMGAASAVDALEGLVPVLGRPEEGSALWRLADGWKTQLSASTAQEARYLQVALLEWERAHNRHPDLSALVRVHVDEGHGTTLLTAAQARQLALALDGLDLRGPVVVRLRDPDRAHLPGQDVRLDVDGRPLLVPADRRASPAPIDPCAVTYFYMTSLVLVSLFRDFGAVPAPAVLAGLATCGAAGIVSHRRIVTHGERARLGVFGLAVGAATLLTLLNGFARSALGNEGEPILGFGTGLLLLSFLGGFYWRSLGRWRWAVPLAAAGNVVLGVLVLPVPSAITGRALVAGVLWGLFPYFPCRHLSWALDRAGARHARSTRAVDEGAEEVAFVHGRESVLGLVRQARDDAFRQLQVLAPRLGPRIAEVAFRRLKEVERRLRSIESENRPGDHTRGSTDLTGDPCLLRTFLEEWAGCPVESPPRSRQGGGTWAGGSSGVCWRRQRRGSGSAC